MVWLFAEDGLRLRWRGRFCCFVNFWMSAFGVSAFGVQVSRYFIRCIALYKFVLVCLKCSENGIKTRCGLAFLQKHRFWECFCEILFEPKYCCHKRINILGEFWSMKLIRLYYKFKSFWSGYTLAYIVVENDKLRFETAKGFHHPSDKLYLLCASEKKWYSSYKKGCYKGKSDLWLKIFEQTHIETWHNMINKGIVDGSSATIEYQFDGQQEFQEIRCVNCYPEKFDLLMELIQSA